MSKIGVEAGGGELVVHHLQPELVTVALDAGNEDALARRFGATRHVAVQRGEDSLGDRVGALAEVGARPLGPRLHLDAAQRRADHVGVQRARGDAVLDRGGDRLLGRLGVSAFERRHEDLEGVLDELGGVAAELLPRVRDRFCRGLP